MNTRSFRSALVGALSACVFAAPAAAADFVFETDPFAGSTALTTPGRQVVGGEPFITFDASADAFVFDPSVFELGTTINFASDVAGDLPETGANVVVLRTLDNDSDPITPFGAGVAATLIADRITQDGAGLFVYFNSGLNVPRLVYSTNLSDPTADLAVLARLTNLSGNTAALADFTADNFRILAAPIPEPSAWALMILGFGAAGAMFRASGPRRPWRRSAA
jgi:hypothetical protein